MGLQFDFNFLDRDFELWSYLIRVVVFRSRLVVRHNFEPSEHFLLIFDFEFLCLSSKLSFRLLLLSRIPWAEFFLCLALSTWSFAVAQQQINRRHSDHFNWWVLANYFLKLRKTGLQVSYLAIVTLYSTGYFEFPFVGLASEFTDSTNLRSLRSRPYDNFVSFCSLCFGEFYF